MVDRGKAFPVADIGRRIAEAGHQVDTAAVLAARGPKNALHLDEPYAPLTLVMCEACSLVQIRETVDPEVLFSSEYPYFSSVSPAGTIRISAGSSHRNGSAPVITDLVAAK